MEHENDSDTNSNCHAQYSHQNIGTGTEGHGNKRTSGDHPNYSIAEICQNIKKSPGNMRRLAVTHDSKSPQVPWGKPSVNACVKDSQTGKIMRIIKYYLNI